MKTVVNKSEDTILPGLPQFNYNQNVQSYIIFELILNVNYIMSINILFIYSKDPNLKKYMEMTMIDTCMRSKSTVATATSLAEEILVLI